jgi:hypothetical protein
MLRAYERSGGSMFARHEVHRALPVLITSGALLLAGCGSSSGSSSGGGSGGALTKAQLASGADAVCTSYIANESKIPVPKNFSSNAVAAAKYLDQLKPLVHQEEAGFEALTPPSSEKADYQKLLTDGKHQIALFDAADAAAHAKDPHGLQDVAAIQSYKKAALAPIERELGFSKC